MKRRIGTFKVARTWVDDNIAQYIYKEVVPLEVRYIWNYDGWEVTAISEHFDEIEPNVVPPQYSVEFKTEEYGTDFGGGSRVVAVSFRKLGDDFTPGFH